jgi:hypothetical protein
VKVVTVHMFLFLSNSSNVFCLFLFLLVVPLLSANCVIICFVSTHSALLVTRVLCVFVRSPTSYHYYLGSCGALDTLWFPLSVSLFRMVSGPRGRLTASMLRLPSLAHFVVAARIRFATSFVVVSGFLLLPRFVFCLGNPSHTLGVAPVLWHRAIALFAYCYWVYVYFIFTLY